LKKRLRRKRKGTILTSLEGIWRELESTGQGLAHRRVDAVHPLDLYVGLNTEMTRELVLVADAVPPEVAKRFKAFEIATTPRADGRYALSVRLRRKELSRLFSHLCEDLVEASRGCTQPNAVRFVSERIARWERLLSRDREGLLTEDALRGLVAELVFLKDLAIPHKGSIEALQGWRGPLGAPHDFQFATAAVEVKSVTETLTAMISSAEQLDSSGERLFLSAVRLHGTTEVLPDSFSVAELVQSLRDVFESDAVCAAEFDAKLSLLGYGDAREYEARRFVVKEVRHFEIDPGFPRLVPSMLPAGLVSVGYGVDLRRCEPFRRPTVF
jgi:hypothetical protein